MIPRIMLTHRSSLIAIVIGGMYNPIIPAWSSCYARDPKKGNSVLLFGVDHGEYIDEVVPMILGYRVDGLISALSILSAEAAESCAKQNIPVVILNGKVRNEWVSSVCCDNVAGGRAIASLFIARGAGHFGYIAGKPDNMANEDRPGGIFRAAGQQGVRDMSMAYGGYRYEGGYRACCELMAASPRPDAIFCANDLMAIGAMETIRTELGLRMPEDVMVAGFEAISGRVLAELRAHHRPPGGRPDGAGIASAARAQDRRPDAFRRRAPPGCGDTDGARHDRTRAARTVPEMATRALIVDNSRTARVRLRRLLETADGGGFEVEEASDGAEALKFMEKTPAARLPDIILLDRNMPRMSGDACIRILKSDPVWKTIPVIFLTAQADKAELVKGLTLLGGDDYLAKPFDAGEMIARVKALVRAKKAEDQNRALTHNLERALEAQRKAYEELKTTKINLAETQAVAMMTRVFEKFVPKQFLQRIALDGLAALKPGNVLASRITILFSDLRSFTTISESMTAKDLFALLNDYLAQMQGPIDHFGGFVDKFIGDAIMALFDQESSAQAEAAVNAAIGMQRQLVEWNHKRQGPPAFPITSGVGIHTGMVMLGTLGSTHAHGFHSDRRRGQSRFATRRTYQAIWCPDHRQRRYFGVPRPICV